MQSYIRSLPADQRATAIQALETELKGGRLNISDYYSQLATTRRKANFHGSLQLAVTGGVIGGVIAVAATGLILPAVIVGGLIITAGGYSAKSRSDSLELDIEDGEWASLLKEKELKELANYLKAASRHKPKTERALSSYKEALSNLQAVADLEDDDGIIDVEAVTVKALPQAAEAIPPKAAVNADGYRTDWRDVFDLIKDHNTYPAVVVIAPQGFGKTTLVEYLLSRLKRNKIVLDPHYEAGAWPGCRVIGAAMNYPAISDALANISADVAERYKQRATYKGYQPAPVALVLEEQTNWDSKVKGGAQFLKETLSDIRKAGYQTISVAHGDTNAARGGAAGTSQMRKEGELKIVLLEKGLAEISLKGRETFKLRYPDPTPYTVSMGEPDVAADGSLGPGFCGTDTPADGEGWGSANVLASNTKSSDTNESANNAFVPPASPSEAPASPLAVELGTSGKTVAAVLDAISRHCHKNPGKLRGCGTLLSRCFSGDTKAAIQPHMEAMLAALVQHHPDCFELDGGKAIRCISPLPSEKDYYPSQHES